MKINIDADAANARLAELDSEIAELDRAISIAEARISEINKRLSEALGPDGENVANAILAGQSLASTPSDAALAEERQQLWAGRATLNRRRDEVIRTQDEIRSDFFSKIAPAFDPIVQEIVDRVGGALAEITQAYADSHAIHLSSRHGRAFQIHVALSGLLGAMGRDHGIGEFRMPKSPVRTSSKALAAAEAALSLGRVCNGRLSKESHLPMAAPMR